MEKTRLITEVLKDCNMKLVQNLAPDHTIEYFYARKVLSASERDFIRSARTHVGQVRELLDVLSKKDDKVLDVLIEYLDFNGNQEHLVQDLKRSKREYQEAHAGAQQDKSGASRDEDFILNYNHAYKLTQILAEDPIIWRNPTIIYNRFLDKSTDRYEVELLIDKDKNTLDGLFLRWISAKSKGATFDTCVQIFRELGLNKAADDIFAKKNVLRNVE